MSPEAGRHRGSGGLSLRFMLVLSFGLVIVCLTTVSLRIVDTHMHRQIQDAATLQFRRSLQAFADAESQRLLEVERENALLADLPSLKALMTTADDLTIEDAGRRFMQISGSDLFALADRTGHVDAVYSTARADASLRRDTEGILSGNADRRYLVSGDHLYGYSVRPILFGDESSGTVLGYVVTGYAVDAGVLQRLAQASDLEAAFLSGDRVLATTLPIHGTTELALRKEQSTGGSEVSLDGEPFAAMERDLSSAATAPLRLLLLRSMRQDEAYAHRVDRLLLLIGLLTGLAGAALMLLVSSGTTRSLRALAGTVDAFGQGRPVNRISEGGPREVRQLSADFAVMQQRIETTSRALLESERLATIGRMARSVSHDLRHHLSTIYANAEFLVGPQRTPEERAEFFGEIQAAVLSTTDMIESLLLFSRTGTPVLRKSYDMDLLLRHSLEVLQRHPEARGVALHVLPSQGVTTVFCDSQQVERALCNLLLNAAQAAASRAAGPAVEVRVERDRSCVRVLIQDNGAGVSQAVRARLFEPFVSEGKQSGTGLGLALAYQVARDHGGSVALVHSEPGPTCFCFSIGAHETLSGQPIVEERDAEMPVREQA